MTTPTKSYILQHSPKRQFVINVVGTLAAILSSVSLMPQLYAVRSSRDIGGLSLGTPLIIVVTSTLWLTYHLLTGTYHGAFSGSFNLMASIIISWTIYDIRFRGAPGIDM
jgi:uncharacterized protein with PQ loop repeat